MGWKEILRRFFGKGVCPYQLSFVLDSPLRRLILSPRKLVERLHLRENCRMLEIGCGSGYFSVGVARHVPNGRLELLDVQRGMIERARRRITSAGLRNVGFVLGDATRLPFSDGVFDVVFLVAVLGEVSNKKECLNEIYRVLKPSGLLSITEQPGDPDFLPMPIVRSLAEGCGFVLAESFGKGKNFTLNFRKDI